MENISSAEEISRIKKLKIDNDAIVALDGFEFEDSTSFIARLDLMWIERPEDKREESWDSCIAF